MVTAIPAVEKLLEFLYERTDVIHPQPKALAFFIKRRVKARRMQVLPVLSELLGSFHALQYADAADQLFIDLPARSFWSYAVTASASTSFIALAPEAPNTE